MKRILTTQYTESTSVVCCCYFTNMPYSCHGIYQLWATETPIKYIHSIFYFISVDLSKKLHVDFCYEN